MADRTASAVTFTTIGGRTDPRRQRAPAYALLAANAVSLAGNQMAALAIPWFVLEMTGSAAKTGLVGFFTFAPMMLAALLGGGIVDRLGSKRTSVVADLLSGATVVAIPILHVAGLLSFPALLILVFLGALLDSPGMTARGALYPDLITLGGLKAERANAFYGAVERFASLVGPPVAGVLVALFAAPAVLWVDAVTFGISAMLVGIAVPGRVSSAEPDPRSRNATAFVSYLDHFREGVRFLWRDRLLRTLALAIALTNFCDAPLAVAMPVYVRDEIGNPEALGWLMGVLGGSALAGALLYGTVGHRLPRRPIYVATFVTVAASLWIMATVPPLPVALLGMAIFGLAAGPLNPILRTVRNERVPAELRGRVFGAMLAIGLSAMPLGVVAGGLLIEAIGVGPTFAIIAACYLAATLSQAVNPVLREMDRPRPSA